MDKKASVQGYSHRLAFKERRSANYRSVKYIVFICLFSTIETCVGASCRVSILAWTFPVYGVHIGSME